MAIVKRIKDLAANREIERLRAKEERSAGLLEYVAMMTDVELPEEEEGANDDDE